MSLTASIRLDVDFERKIREIPFVIGMTLKEKFANYRWRIPLNGIRELPFVTIMLDSIRLDSTRQPVKSYFTC